MFRQSVRAISAKRLLSVTPRANNLVSDLYVQNIKQFKPQAISQQEIDAAVKTFQLPAKPSLPENEVSTEALGEYESSEVEATSGSSGASLAAEEDWFVFEEEAEEHH
ncbi:uncharacterized protein CANTADRAFT_48016 [Suhomyces tanzawaensis NRRL Y-17324]|uniref:Uncharacterized protein n=1 Tax=Suhomyces tanzawaensis NRRL Y-17324 TaxID=984487 RepID=A0A1E4SMD4_9ASCO|nr:uncharacterized protein CANTADRAFT_48016 [Suhomyces tanzawaensis NRRL Y-17324]ODV80689.1 hypothetical protein CANTADRAFT_48016 [Suhomyces tanzawaensis NRRL Y-17324]